MAIVTIDVKISREDGDPEITDENATELLVDTFTKLSAPGALAQLVATIRNAGADTLRVRYPCRRATAKEKNAQVRARIAKLRRP